MAPPRKFQIKKVRWHAKPSPEWGGTPTETFVVGGDSSLGIKEIYVDGPVIVVKGFIRGNVPHAINVPLDRCLWFETVDEPSEAI